MPSGPAECPEPAASNIFTISWRTKLAVSSKNCSCFSCRSFMFSYFSIPNNFLSDPDCSKYMSRILSNSLPLRILYAPFPESFLHPLLLSPGETSRATILFWAEPWRETAVRPDRVGLGRKSENRKIWKDTAQVRVPESPRLSLKPISLPFLHNARATDSGHEKGRLDKPDGRIRRKIQGA